MFPRETTIEREARKKAKATVHPERYRFPSQSVFLSARNEFFPLGNVLCVELNKHFYFFRIACLINNFVWKFFSASACVFFPSFSSSSSSSLSLLLPSPCLMFYSCFECGEIRNMHNCLIFFSGTRNISFGIFGASYFRERGATNLLHSLLCKCNAMWKVL